MTSYFVSLCHSSARLMKVATDLATVRGEKHNNETIISSEINWDMCGTSFSSSLILLEFCLDFSFSRSISEDSSLFFLDSATILVAATSPAKPDVPEQKSR